MLERIRNDGVTKQLAVLSTLLEAMYCSDYLNEEYALSPRHNRARKELITIIKQARRAINKVISDDEAKRIVLATVKSILDNTIKREKTHLRKNSNIRTSLKSA